MRSWYSVLDARANKSWLHNAAGEALFISLPLRASASRAEAAQTPNVLDSEDAWPHLAALAVEPRSYRGHIR